jgi:hypothetical protein
MDYGYGPARSAGAELLAEDAVFAHGDGRVVEAACVDGDLVPATDTRSSARRKTHLSPERKSGLSPIGIKISSPVINVASGLLRSRARCPYGATRYRQKNK